MNENTFLKVGNGNEASQPMDNSSMGMPPMGGDASSMPMGGGQDMGMTDPSMGGGQDMGMTDPSMDGGQTSMDGDMGMNGQSGDGFDMGIGMTPEEDPKKWIQGASTKLASELRKYQKSQPSPDIETSKTAVNTVAAASKENLDDSQKNELMTSYAETMRKDGDNSDGSDDFTSGSDEGQTDDSTEQDMGMTDTSMGGGQDMGMTDPSMGGGQDMGMQNGTPQQMMESKVNSIVSEMLSDITKGNKKENNISSKVKHKEQSKNNNYSFKPYTAKVNR